MDVETFRADHGLRLALFSFDDTKGPRCGNELRPARSDAPLDRDGNQPRSTSRSGKYRMRIGAILSTLIGAACFRWPGSRPQTRPAAPPRPTIPTSGSRRSTARRPSTGCVPRTARLLRAREDPRFERFHAEALAIAEAKERMLHRPRKIAGRIYNFWQDASHVHGLWRGRRSSRLPPDEHRLEAVLDRRPLEDGKRQLGLGGRALRGARRAPVHARAVGWRRGRRDRARVRFAPARFVSGGFALPKGNRRPPGRARIPAGEPGMVSR